MSSLVQGGCRATKASPSGSDLLRAVTSRIAEPFFFLPQGAPLLLIQGIAGHHAVWGEPFLSLLEQDYDVLAFDHRGIGESDRADEPFTVAEMADDAAKLMAAVGWDDAHVLGISMGGMVAQELAVRHPERIRTLALGCTYAGPGGSLEAPGPLRMVEAMNTGDVAKILRAGYEGNLSPGVPRRRVPVRPEVSLSVRVPSPVILMQLRAVLQHDAVAGLRNLDVPTLVVHGTADEMILPVNGRHVASLVPDARLETMDGVGHLFWWEQPERTAELVRAHAR